MTDHDDAMTRAAMLSLLEDLAEARAQAHAYRAIADGLVSRLTAHAVVAGADGLVREVNDAALHLMGSRREEVLGKHVERVRMDVWQALLSANSDGSLPASDDAWRAKLTPEQYAVMRGGGTEKPFSGRYTNDHERGTYACAACGQELFSSDAKFDSGTGWPSFTDPVNLRHVTLLRDERGGMARTEVRCARCGSHLGHVFDDGPPEKGGKRYCINSVCLLKKPMP